MDQGRAARQCQARLDYQFAKPSAVPAAGALVVPILQPLLRCRSHPRRVSDSTSTIGDGAEGAGTRARDGYAPAEQVPGVYKPIRLCCGILLCRRRTRAPRLLACCSHLMPGQWRGGLSGPTPAPPGANNARGAPLAHRWREKVGLHDDWFTRKSSMREVRERSCLGFHPKRRTGSARTGPLER